MWGEKIETETASGWERGKHVLLTYQERVISSSIVRSTRRHDSVGGVRPFAGPLSLEQGLASLGTGSLVLGLLGGGEEEVRHDRQGKFLQLLGLTAGGKIVLGSWGKLKLGVGGIM